MEIRDPWSFRAFSNLLASQDMLLATPPARPNPSRSLVIPRTGAKGSAGPSRRTRERGAGRAFLEAAAASDAARRLFLASGWSENRRRQARFSTPAGRVDAIVASKRPVGA